MFGPLTETPKLYLGALGSSLEVTLLVSCQKLEIGWLVSQHLSTDAWNIPHHQYKGLGGSENSISEVITSEGTQNPRAGLHEVIAEPLGGGPTKVGDCKVDSLVVTKKDSGDLIKMRRSFKMNFMMVLGLDLSNCAGFADLGGLGTRVHVLL